MLRRFTEIATLFFILSILVPLSLAQDSETPTEPDDEEKIPERPSQGTKAQITLSVLESLLLTEHESGADCRFALEDAIDQSHYFAQNRTAKAI